ncbi:hypothetical protein NP493_2962g00001 [Ridgeia piscesae]|uniref:Nipped-B protein n=1 Tax=Ridgeia piscesae TaxID=27915 RepID=A0AAD9JC43_RIDPI|nr:hypothetical protein NP493_2962g00001 [Ridgeia piscesae]
MYMLKLGAGGLHESAIDSLPRQLLDYVVEEDSSMASTIIQVYIKQILESFFHHHSQVKMIALGVITLILRQGLMHPVQIVPHLISMGTDSDSTIRAKAAIYELC